VGWVIPQHPCQHNDTFRTEYLPHATLTAFRYVAFVVSQEVAKYKLNDVLPIGKFGRCDIKWWGVDAKGAGAGW